MNTRALTLLIAAGMAAGFGSAAAAKVTILPAAVQGGVFKPINGSFTEVLPTLDGITHANLAGVYGVEMRRGNNQNNGDWEIGVGQATSNIGANNFTQGNFRWSSDNSTTIANGGGVATNFSLSWVPAATVSNPSGLSVTLGANSLNPSAVTVASPGGARAAFLGGNTLKIFAKRDTIATITSIDGQAFNTSIFGQPGGAGNALSEYFFYSKNNWGGDGFTVSGTIRMSGANGGSGNGLLFKSGNFVPEPATWAMLITGFGLTGIAMRRRAGRAVVA